MEAVLVPLIVFVFVGANIIVPMVMEHRSKKQRQDILRDAMAKGTPLDPATIAALGDLSTKRPKPAQSPGRKSLGTGLILTLLAMGLAGAAVVDGVYTPNRDNDQSLVIGGLILGCIGIGYLILSIIDYRSKPRIGQD